ncbi:MAG: response regulator transcription factor [Solirubrobacteraceae bacterium]
MRATSHNVRRPGQSVLVAEPASPSRAVLMADLRRSGYEVTAADDLAGAISELVAGRFHVVVLDAGLAGGSGGDVPACQEMIGAEIPVILLMRGASVADRVHALEAGAVDVVATPYSPLELAARVRTRIRFMREASPMRLRGAGIEIDLITREVTLGDEPVLLSNTEYRLLVYFLRNAGLACHRREIVTAVWGGEARADGNLVEVYVGYLRRKLDRDGAPFPLSTLRNIGYRFDSAPSAASAPARAA